MMVCLSLISIVWMIVHYGIDIRIKKDTTHKEIVPEFEPINIEEMDPSETPKIEEDPIIREFMDSMKTMTEDVNRALYGEDENNETGV